MKVVSYNYSLDVFKFLLALMIVCNHIYIYIYKELQMFSCFSGFHLAVEFYFIISGLFIGNNYCRMRNLDANPFLTIKSFVINRLVRLYPAFFVAILISALIKSMIFKNFSLQNLLPNLFLLGDINGVVGIVSGGWYVSVLFWVSVFIFSSMVLFREKFIFFFLPLFCYWVYYFMINVPQRINIISKPVYFGVISGGMLRGLLGIGLGVLAFFFIQNYKDILKRKLEKYSVFYIAEILSLIYVGYLFSKYAQGQRQIDVYFVAPLIIVSLYKRIGYLYKFLDILPIPKFILDASYMLYLTHITVVLLVKNYAFRFLPKNDWTFFIILLITVAFSVILNKFCDIVTSLVKQH